MDEDVRREHERHYRWHYLLLGVAGGIIIASTVDLVLTWLVLCARHQAAVCQ